MKPDDPIAPAPAAEESDVVDRLLALHPDRLHRKARGGVRSRRTTNPASSAFAARLIAVGIDSKGATRRARPGRLMRDAAPLSPEIARALGLNLPTPPRTFEVPRAAARLGYDFSAADMLVDLVRQTGLPQPKGRWLLLGCGCGLTARGLQESLPGTSWTALDGNAEAVDWAKKHIPGPDFGLEPYAPPLADSDASFDGAVLLDVGRARSASQVEAWLAELRRVVKADGLLALAAHGVGTLAALADEARAPAAMLMECCRHLEAGDNGSLATERGPLTIYAEQYFRAAAGKAGWEVRLSLLAGGPRGSDAYLMGSVDAGAVDMVPIAAAPAIGSASGEARRFVVLAMMRTGSNMVVSSLNTHPNVYCHGELLHAEARPTSALDRALEHLDPVYRDNAWRGVHAGDFLEAVYALPYDSQFVGFKYLLTQAAHYRRTLLEDQRYAAILLFRENVLARFASNSAAIARRQGGHGALARFDERNFEHFRAQQDRLYAETRDVLRNSGRPYLEMPYLAASTPEGMRQMLLAIGADPNIPLGVVTPKRASSDILSRFVNRDAVERYLVRKGLLRWATESA